MLFISRIKIHNFKSFKFVDVTLPRTYVCLAGPNGSGKSNVLDAIRFACGEISLKSLRAKKVRDLILSGTNTAEVTVYFDGDEKIEIKRAIRSDGKILYKLNGVKTTRGAIIELLKKHNVDESGRNTIAQGEVQRIINMGGKERRQIIDSVAGISDFEAKKDEAMRELEQVNNKIKDANLVLGEKDAFLAQLERERADALVYVDAKKNLANAKGTLLEREIKKLDSDLTEVCESEQKTKGEIEKRESAIAKTEADIKRVDSARLNASKELQAKQQTAGIIRRIEELKALLATKEQMVKDKEELAKRLEKEINGLNVDSAGKKSSVSELEKEIAQLKRDFVALESENEKFSSFKSSGELEKLETQISNQEEDLRLKREHAISLEAEIRSKNEVAELKRQEQNAIDSTLPKELENEKAEEKIQKMKAEVKELAGEIDSLFQREKELNSESAELDRKLLELREKHSVMRVQSSPALASLALKFVQDLRAKGSVDGIYGTVADLIRFDSKYTSAIEAAGGNRLLYVVVEDSNTASKIITLLKKASAGRATFIPLKDVKTAQPPEAMNGFKSVINIMEYSSDVARAVEYVFAETLLVDSMEDAKRIGLRHARMVTLDGEIFERSGIISGGKVASSVLASTQLTKIEGEISKVKEEKAAIMQELLDSRESASKLRSKKAELEVKAKSAEIELRGSSEMVKSREKALARKKQLETEITDALASANSLAKEGEKLGKLVSELETHVSKAKERRDSELEKERSGADQTSKKKTDLAAKVSSLRATIEGKLKEAELRKNELFKLEERIKVMHQEKMDACSRVAEMKKASTDEGKELAQQEEKISSTSRQIERIFETIKKYESDLQSLGAQREKTRLEMDRVTRDMNQLNIKKATVETKLADLKAEFDGHGQYETLTMNKEELHTLVKSSEVTITTMTNVNMAAIDMYGKKKAEIEEIRGKIKTLDDERKAILMMMDEISQKKKDAFFKTFYAVNDYFRKMFAYISIGEGFLYLDKPEEPFESGMYIKLKRNNREHTLDSLSGGENSLVALMFIFAMQLFKPSPFYVLDEVDAALDKDNSKHLAQLIKRMSEKTQFMVVSHNDTTMALADSVLGVTKVGGVSKLVGVRLEQRSHAGSPEQVEVIQ
ncbi:MAG: chromosome segregation SMC family protein [Candidatus Micrarchaeota archaeon]